MQLEPFDDVAQIDRLIEIVKVAFLFGVSREQCAFGKFAEGHVCVTDLEEIFCVRQGLDVFCKGERKDVNDFAMTSKFSRNVFGQQMRVGLRHVCADIVAFQESVENMVEGDVSVLAVFGSQAGKIGAFGKNGLGVLDFVDQDKARRIVRRQSCANLIAECNAISTKGEGFGLRVDRDDVIGRYSGIKQVLLEKLEEQKTLAIASYADKYLNQIVVFGFDESF